MKRLLVVALAAFAGVGIARADAAPGIEIGVEERVRSENFDNASDFNASTPDMKRQWRWRTRAWAKVPVGDVSFSIGLDNESRKVTDPDTPFHSDETIVETLFVDLPLGRGATLRVGRQNFQRGEGFVALEGSAGDGSRSTYVNGVDVGLPLAGGRLDLVAFSDPHRDTYLPRGNDQRRTLNERDERVVGGYWARPGGADRAAVDAYWLSKSETGDVRPPTALAYRPDRRFHTVGARVVQPVGAGVSLTGELALQRGTQEPDGTIRAWGGYAYARKAWDVRAKPTLQVGYWRMSGDDPRTRGTDEGWDPVLSRWPKWSELYIYSQVGENGVAYWTDTAFWQAEATVTPTRWFAGRATWYRMTADHAYPGRPSVFANGTGRGDLFETRADVAAGSHWRGHVLFERFAPGSFYTGHDAAWFFRAEVMYTLRLTLG